MIREKTVFILGAGASRPYGFPTGKELRRKICAGFLKRLEQLIEEVLPPMTKRQLMGHAKDFVFTFQKSGNESIDLWLNRNQEYSDIGKLAIALTILDVERGSRYYEDVPDEEDWCRYLYARMTQTLIDPDTYGLLKHNSVSFITFNYDRSLEHYLYQCLSNSFTVLRRNMPSLNELFPFRPLHVFGKIADLTWESRGGVDYGIEPDHQRIDQLKTNIRTIFERTNHELSQRIKGEIATAKRVFFLGFGYHPENLTILGIPGVLNKEQEIYGTAFGFTPREIKGIREILNLNFPQEWRSQLTYPVIEPVSCYKLLREHL